ncbi:MAG: YARHG domain-containing protein [Clostridia bacterium]|nr:YARHG domain-containing protein [Clostridia bacterium]
MNKKLFIFLVVLLSGLIIASLIWLVISIHTYNRSMYPQEKPSYFTDNKKDNEKEKTDDATIDTQNNKPDELDNDTATVSSNKVENDKFFDENVVEIKESDLTGLDYDFLNKAYNAIFARHGHDFKTKSLKDFFSQYSWYKPVDGKVVSIKDLSELENKNLNLIKEKIDKVKAQ